MNFMPHYERLDGMAHSPGVRNGNLQGSACCN